MKFNKDAFEIIFFARAGQGAKTAAEIVAQAAMSEGKNIQAFPYYGPERSGAPTKAFVRVSDRPVRTHEPVVDPDVVLVLDDTLLESQDVANNLDREESLIINTKMSKEEVARKIPKFKGRIHNLDATKIAVDIIGKPNFNSVIIGKLIQVSEVAKLESAIDEFHKIFDEKIGKELTEKNIKAMEEGYDTL